MNFSKKLLISLFLFLMAAGNGLSQQNSLSFLALGDSYTIGEKVDKAYRWPVQLADSLNERGFDVSEPRIIAKTGWTTDELLQAVKKSELKPPYGLVSLLIGVNNQYRGYDISQYRKEFKTLLEKSIALAGDRPKRVFVVSIPDYGVTPFGRQKNPEKIARELENYNDIARNIAEKHNVTFINITPISRRAKNDSALVASDGLHPSGKMYQLWVSRILPHVISKLQ